MEEPRSREGTGLPQGRDDRIARCPDPHEGAGSPRRGEGEGPRRGLRPQGQGQDHRAGTAPPAGPQSGVGDPEDPPTEPGARDPNAGSGSRTSPRRGPSDAREDRGTPLVTGGPAPSTPHPGSGPASRTHAERGRYSRRAGRRSGSSAGGTG